MKVEETDIPCVRIFTPAAFEDPRGYFTETYNHQKFAPHTDDLSFVQDNESYSKEIYTVRGLHYQAPPFAQAKLVRVLVGRIFDVAVDVRKGSKTYGRWVGAELSADNRKQLLAPAGFLHGFMTLEPETRVAYKVSNFYNKESDGAVFWASEGLGVSWPVPAEKVILSDKDAAARDFADFDSPF